MQAQKIKSFKLYLQKTTVRKKIMGQDNFRKCCMCHRFSEVCGAS